MRLDQYLVKKNYFESRQKAQVAIKAGHVSCKQGTSYRVIMKPSFEVNTDSVVLVESTPELRYVSRSGLKLDEALSSFGVSVDGLIAVDVGQSTGGFTDCLIRRGAKFVVGLDVGRDQLHPNLRGHNKIKCVESFNAKNPFDVKTLGDSVSEELLSGFGLMVIDVSFISLKSILIAQGHLLKPGSLCIALLKPQFEVGPKNLLKGGIADPKQYERVIEDVKLTAKTVDLDFIDIKEACIKGRDGNQEFVIQFRKSLSCSLNKK